MAVKWHSSATTICALCILVVSNGFADGVRVGQPKRAKPAKGECEKKICTIPGIGCLVNVCRELIFE